MKRTWRRKNDERGFSLVFVGLGFMAFIAASVLAIDVGMLMTARSQAQNSADAAALAGATALVFDDWNDRSASGPAVRNAIAGGKANLVMGESVAIDPVDVTFPNDPVTGDANRVRAKVYRDSAHGNPLSTLMAQVLKISTANISAVATAEAESANAMTCVKPFTIPDLWIEKNGTPALFSRYDKKGNVLSPADVYEPAYLEPPPNQTTPNPKYSGYNTKDHLGEKLVLRAGQGNDIQPSFYYSLAMTNDTGGQDYRWNIANCNHTIYHWGDLLVQEPGDKEGPTIQGILDLIARDPGAQWDDSTNTVIKSNFPERKSPRIFPIPLYDPDYYDFGKATGRVASLRTANWIGFFVEYVGNGSEIHGRIMPIAGIRDKTYTGGVSSFPKTIRLVE